MTASGLRRAESRETISIVIPVLNEENLIAPFLRHLRRRAPEAELVVVDGGSSDETAARVAGLAHKFVVAEAGRASQMNAGASMAGGDIVWFLHCDCRVPRKCLSEIRILLAAPHTVGGYFRVRIASRAFIYRLTDCFAHYAGHVLRIRCGDHGFFCRRELFQMLGGFPSVPLMEDVEFYRALWRQGRVRSSARRLLLSARRYQRVGPWRVTFAYGLIAILYAVGVPLRFLARVYARTAK